MMGFAPKNLHCMRTLLLLLLLLLLRCRRRLHFHLRPLQLGLRLLPLLQPSPLLVALST